jgi:hypothetical protein
MPHRTMWPAGLSRGTGARTARPKARSLRVGLQPRRRRSVRSHSSARRRRTRLTGRPEERLPSLASGFGEKVAGMMPMIVSMISPMLFCLSFEPWAKLTFEQVRMSRERAHQGGLRPSSARVSSRTTACRRLRRGKKDQRRDEQSAQHRPGPATGRRLGPGGSWPEESLSVAHGSPARARR